MDVLIKVFKQHNQDLTDSSAKAYAKNLVRLYTLYTKQDAKDMNERSLKFLIKDYKNVIVFLKDTYPNITTRRNYLNSILIFIKIQKAKEKVIKSYEVIRDDMNDEYDKIANTKSERVSKNWITLKEYDDLIEKMYGLFKDNDGFKDVVKDSIQFWEIQDLVILLFYRSYPLRNDLAHVLVKTALEYKKENDKENNYLVIRRDSFDLVLNKYKTAKTYGQNIISISLKDNPRLYKVIRRWLEENTSGYFILDRKFEPITGNSLCRLVSSIFEKYIHKKTTTGIIRDVVLTEMFGDKNAEQEKMAKLMMNSVKVQDQVYIKKK